MFDFPPPKFVFSYRLVYSNVIYCFVFQEKLQNSFRQATAKISATIGLGLPRTDNNDLPPLPPDEVITVDYHDNGVPVTDNEDAVPVTDNDE